ncbi:Rieske 2Fe-2S domain-containing protein [Aerosakkonema sp. BLCC-F183]|uniref:aromatic ring-hydroxylating dioxygenase subunit alpha n=1 Tax=Aerosakkonema sp. BLCC-F183 TaxID=3342834 RepID=UPI0035B8EAF9
MISIEQPILTEEDIAQKTVNETNLDVEQSFNWKHCWYPVAFIQDLPKNRPYSFSLYDEPYVLFRNQDSKLICLTDRCPHRAARLSDGQIIDGKLECLYHGWQFGIDGQCLHIPQLPADAKIPAKACVRSFKLVERQGIVWMWPGETEIAQEESIPTIPDLDNPEFVTTDYMCDLPHDQSYFIENVLDPAHAHISHHGSISNRKNAQPLEMEVIESSHKGIFGRMRNAGDPNKPWTPVDFVAPNLVYYRFSIEARGWFGGVVFYSIPLSQNRCRVLVRNYRNFFTWKLKLTPRTLDHWLRSRVLEEDLPQILGEKAEIERLDKPMKEVFLPLKTSDLFVIEYRKWLDKFGIYLPFYQGYETAKLTDDSSKCHQEPALQDRFSRHTQICSSCNRAYQVTNKLKQAAVGVAIAFAALGIVTDGFASTMAVSAALLAVALAVVAAQAKTKFERSYTRH